MKGRIKPSVMTTPLDANDHRHISAFCFFVIMRIYKAQRERCRIQWNLFGTSEEGRERYHLLFSAHHVNQKRPTQFTSQSYVLELFNRNASVHPEAD